MVEGPSLHRSGEMGSIDRGLEVPAGLFHNPAQYEGEVR